MIRSRLGKRIPVVIVSLVLLLHFAVYPVARARAAAVLPAVGAAITVAAFLNAFGIFPYNAGDTTFGEWGAQNLADLWEQYVVDTGIQTTAFNAIKAFVIGNVLAYPKVTWQSLREFVQWIVDKFSVTDNQSGIILGSSDSLYKMPFNTAVAVAGYGNTLHRLFVTVNSASDDVYGAWIYSEPAFRFFLFSTSSFSASFFSDVSYFDGVYNGINYKYAYSSGSGSVVSVTHDSSLASSVRLVPLDIPIFDSSYTFEDVVSVFLSSISDSPVVVADTSTVSVPGELNPDSVFAGLRVSGLPAQTTIDAVEDAIEQGVQVRAQPVVELTEVELGEGTVVDTETGAITQNPGAVIEGEIAETVPGVDAFTPPQSFIDTMINAVRTKFPFCIPFQIFEIIEAFVVPPSAPVISLTFHDPFTDADYAVSVDLSPWDEVAAVVRQFETMILLVTFLLNFSKFDPLQYFFGNHVAPIGFHD